MPIISKKSKKWVATWVAIDNERSICSHKIYGTLPAYGKEFQNAFVEDI